jgi:hypothetical protein
MAVSSMPSGSGQSYRMSNGKPATIEFPGLCRKINDERGESTESQMLVRKRAPHDVLLQARLFWASS